MKFLFIAGYLLASQWLAGAQAVASPGPNKVAWHRISLSPEASISLPGAVKAKLGRDTAIKVFASYSQHVVCTAVVKKLNLPTALAAELNPYAVYQGVIKGAINNLANGRIVRQTPFTLASQHGLEVELELPGQPNLAPSYYLHMLYANGWLYICSWRQLAAPTTAPVPDDAAARRSFFATLQLRPGSRSLATTLVTGGRVGWVMLRVLALLSVLLAAIAVGWRYFRRA